MPTPYEPQAGTFAHRAIEYLKTLPAGTKVATAALGEQLGQPSIAVAALLHPARKAGVVVAENDPMRRRLLLWSLPAGSPVAQSVDGQERDLDPPRQLVLPAGQWPPARVAEPEPELEPAPTPAVEETNITEAQGQREQHIVKRAWFCSDGTNPDTTSG